TSAIMNPYQPGASAKKIAARIAELEALGVVIPEGIDPAVLAPLIGLGSTTATPSKEVEAIKAADFLLNNDPSGAGWIRLNKAAGAPAEGARANREGRRQRRRA